jgi:acyl carrier protein
MDRKTELKQLLIEGLSLEDTTPDDIADDQPLFGEGLGLDSLDAVELVVLLQKKYGISIEDTDQGREAFASINALNDFIEKKK